MRDNASLIGFWIVGGEWIVEECQHACREGEAYEKGGGEGKWKSMHEKEQGSSARYHRGRTLSSNTKLAGLKLKIVNKDVASMMIRNALINFNVGFTA